MIWSISWKNVWRSKRRSLVVIGAVTLGTIAGVFTAGIMKGWVEQRISSAINTEVSHIQLHNPNYLNNEELKYTITKQEKINDFLDQSEMVKAYSNRFKVMAMASTSRGNTALKLHGIHVNDEMAVSNVYEKIQPNGGQYLEEKMKNKIVISDKTAEQLRIKNYNISANVIDSLKKQDIPITVIEKLKPIENKRFKTEKVFKSELENILNKKTINKYGARIVESSKHYRLRAKIVFTFTGKDGQMSYQSYRVCGIYKTTNTMFDQMNAFVMYTDLAPIAGFEGKAYHETAIILHDEDQVKLFKNELINNFSELSILDWKELAPDAGMLSQYMGFYYYIIMGFILFALAFGIINTMLMAILERIKELGMLMAIGMNKKRVFNMIMLETIFLTMVGALIGMALGALLIAITNKTGLNFSGVSEGFEAIGWSAVIYPNINWLFFFGITVMVIITGILSSIIPARKALKLNPIDAIRTE